MPLLGLKVLITSGAIVDIFLGLFLLAICIKQVNTKSRVMLPVTAVTALVVMISTFMFEYDKERLSSGIFRTGDYLQESQNLFYKDGKTSTVSVFRQEQSITLANNGKPDASIYLSTTEYSGDETTQTLVGILPLLHKPGAENAAIIGMGSGLSTHAILSSPELKQVDTIEIEAAVVEAANLFRPKSEKAYSDERSYIHIDDAKTFFTTHGHKYDVIVSEPPNPWVSGVSSLFTREFYQRIKNHMNSDAVFVQWLQLYEIDIELVATVFNALSLEFSDYVVYSSNNGSDMIIIARKDGLITPAVIPTDPNSEITRTLSDHGINSYNDLQLRLVSGKQLLGPAFSNISGLVNSDYFPHLDNGAARSRFALSRADELYNMLMYKVPIMRTLQSDMRIDSDKYTYTNTYKPAANMYSANLFYKSLIHGETDDTNMDGRRNLRSTFLTAFKQKLANCSKQDSEQIAGMLQQLASFTLPYLSRDELGSLWQVVEISPCIQSTEPNSDLRQWVYLYTAISERDLQKTKYLSEKMLASIQHSDNKLTEFLVVSALLGNFFSDDDNTAAILEKWGDMLLEGSDETRLATAILTGRTGRGTAGANSLANSH